MLNSRNIIIVFIVVLVILVYLGQPIWVCALWGLLCTLPLGWGSYSISSNVYIPVLCSGPKDRRVIALSFDDGPAEQYTPQILEILEGRGVEAAFFCIGTNIKGREGLLRRIHEGGHLIGNHSYSHHFWFDLFSSRRMRADLAQMDAAVREVLGVTPRLFRPPYGVTNPNLARAIRRGGYTPVGWNVRSLDTVINDPVKLTERVSAALKPGAIILLHDTSAATLAMLPRFIDAARIAGYAFQRLDKMCNLTPYV
jgi:peptidoglycan-N-acetylglucosamine deacetylase